MSGEESGDDGDADGPGSDRAAVPAIRVCRPERRANVRRGCIGHFHTVFAFFVAGPYPEVI